MVKKRDVRINYSQAEDMNCGWWCERKEDGKNRQLMGLHLRKNNVFFDGCLLFIWVNTKMRPTHAVCAVLTSPHMDSNGFTLFIHQRSHTYKSNNDEGRQAVCAWGGRLCCIKVYCLYMLYWSFKKKRVTLYNEVRTFSSKLYKVVS